MSNCVDCFSGCLENISDKCIKYSGLDIIELGITTNMQLSEIENKLFIAIKTLLTGEGIILNLSDITLCDLIVSYLPITGTINLQDIINALILSLCSLQTNITVINNSLNILNNTYTKNCLTGTIDLTNTHSVVQAIITNFCNLKSDFALTVQNLSTNYVRLDAINSIIAAYLTSLNLTNGTNGLNSIVTKSSTTPLSISNSGTKTLNFSSTLNLGWIIGTRLKFFNSITSYMEGVVSSIPTTTSVTITVDNSEGTGIFSSWNITIAGDKGTATNNSSEINLQKIIRVNPTLTPTYSYTLSNNDNGYSIYINIENMNGNSAFNIIIPLGLDSKFICGIAQRITGNSGVINLINDGVSQLETIGVSRAIRGEGYSVCIEQISNTGTYFILGDVI